MKTIIIGFSKPKNFQPFAWLIQKAYNVPYDHVYVKIHSDKYQRDLIYQASKTMVNFMGVQIFDSQNDILKEFALPISIENMTALMQFAIDKAGTPYGVKECLGLAIVRICEIFGRTIKNPFSDGGTTYVCSELASYVLQQFLSDKIPKDISDMTPLDVYNYLTGLAAAPLPIPPSQ